MVGTAVSSEAQPVSREAAAPLVEMNIGQLLERYSAKDIFNADETALFYKMLPQKTLALKGGHRQGGKQR